MNIVIYESLSHFQYLIKKQVCVCTSRVAKDADTNTYAVIYAAAYVVTNVRLCAELCDKKCCTTHSLALFHEILCHKKCRTT